MFTARQNVSHLVSLIGEAVARKTLAT